MFKMSKSRTLRALVTERLTAAAEEIFVLFERTIAEYEEELRSSRNENRRNLRHLEALKPRVLLSRPGTEVPLPSTSLGPGLHHIITKIEEIKEETEEVQIVTEEIKEETEELPLMSDPGFGTFCGMKEEPSQLQIQTECREGTPGVSSGGKEDADYSSYWELPTGWGDGNEEVDDQVQIGNGGTAAQNSGLSPGNTSVPGTNSAVNDGHASGADKAKSRKKGGQKSGKKKSGKRSKAPSGEKPYPCSMCVKEFTCSSTLNRHMRTHTGMTLYSCSLCFQRFRCDSNLTEHMRTHTGEKPYSCSYCDKRFKGYIGLINHMRVHDGQTPYRCSRCWKRFVYVSALKSHMKTHTAEKPFSCTICYKTFSQIIPLNRHKRKHMRS